MSLPSNKFAHLRVPLENILSATNNFAQQNVISTSAFGKRYKGQLLWSGELIDITARRFNKERTDKEQLLWMDISMLSSLKHKNLVSLVGFCDENDEKIIINRRETRGMLLNYLSDPMLLTWVRRLEISVGLAHALSYIHYNEPRDFSVIHRNINSGSVVLNDGWEPKLRDFEHSIKIKAFQRHNSFHTNIPWYVKGYGDPAYIETKSVNHKSDMYSFGIVLFELLCGRTSIIDSKDNKYLVWRAIDHYREKRLDEMIDWDLWKQMDSQSFDIFTKTAPFSSLARQGQKALVDPVQELIDNTANRMTRKDHHSQAETKGMLNKYLSDPMSLSWVRRLEISVGLAHALSYIHYDEPRDFSIIHQNIKSGTVVLNDGWEPKLCDFERSMKIKASQRHNSFRTNKLWYVDGYGDPTYTETKSVNHKSDMYSFGIVLFELLCGRKCESADQDNKYLGPVAIFHYKKKIMDEIIDPVLWEQMNPQSFNVLAETAYDCINEERSQRPNIDEIVARVVSALKLQLEHENVESLTSRVESHVSKKTKSFLQDLSHLKLSFQDIKSATNNFAQENIIRTFTLGTIYKGRILHSQQLIDIIVKRFYTKCIKDESKKIWTEISMLSSLKHKNLVSLIGILDDRTNKMIIYKEEANGSLKKYLSDRTLTWMQRLKICVGVAKALSYIHYDVGRDFSVIHCNVKSSKILLDDKLESKLSGFELSLKNTVARRHRLVLTRDIIKNVYLDPKYKKTGGMTHKSDVYSFGVVLLEVLCGRSAVLPDEELGEGLLSKLVKSNLDDMIDPHLRKQMDSESLKIYSETVYCCVKEERADRPYIDQVVKRLEKAFELQWKHQNPELPRNALEGTSSDHLKN
ncbi:kinase-like domain, phloem protein 2-like protein [Tanacetum coccineum]